MDFQGEITGWPGLGEGPVRLQTLLLEEAKPEPPTCSPGNRTMEGGQMGGPERGQVGGWMGACKN